MISYLYVYVFPIQVVAFITGSGPYATETISEASSAVVSASVNQLLSLITPAPKVDAAAIRERAELATCAYVRGNAGKRHCE